MSSGEGCGLRDPPSAILPLSDSAFLALEATFTTKHINPVHPALTRPAFQAGVGLGLEF